MGTERNTRAEILRLLGSFPETGPLDPEIISTEDTAEFTRTLVEYNVEPDDRIRAYLLVPNDLEPGEQRSGILAIHQHAGEFYLGKSEPAGCSTNEMYHYGVELCQRGYVVLCPDQLCFEERQRPEHRRREGRSPKGIDYEKFEAMKYLLHGSTLQAKYLSDLSIAIDYLSDLDQVNADEIGVIGHSLGGQECIWLSWYDDRVKAGIASCGVSRYDAILRDEVTHNFTFYIPGLLEICDMDEILIDIAPQPMMLTNGEGDRTFPVDAVRQMAATVEEVYAAADCLDRFESIVFPGSHAFPEDIREETYSWIDTQLG